MTQELVMVVEDDNAMRNLIVDLLEREDYKVVSTGDGSEVLELFKASNPALVLMDIQLPGVPGPTPDTFGSGIDLVRAIVDYSISTPVIMVTAKPEDENLEAYKAGAINYIEKPFAPDRLRTIVKNSLKLRVEKVSVETDAEILKIGPLTLDIIGHEVRRNGEKIALTPLEFKLLATLAAAPKRVFSRETLLKDVWDYPYQGDTRLVNVHIQRLRSKIEDDPDNPKIVETVRGVGYKAGQN